ncbi:HNH endonuclease family protein [Lysinibacter cavernae]|uniref:GmrSD restriction endonucleases C-terminal domain-containing protein n=1 Tax=Lysinibacter cavernae TaxID=1640652 RepID=A0A7X5TTB5_9MICO|nr:HNH endonuclease family protein [Lysinibacter cavernae]NIH52507.1 hypothetical protein [Lysinibacter cavernae]
MAQTERTRRMAARGSSRTITRSVRRARRWLVVTPVALLALVGSLLLAAANSDTDGMLGGAHGPDSSVLEPAGDGSGVGDGGSIPFPEAVTGKTAAEVLALIPTKGKAPKTGYNRTGVFGEAWSDVDHNGCDTRNDILARDLTNTVAPNGCKIITGTLADPYTGRTIDFVRGDKTSPLVQIDHVVALSNAWQTGAQQLSDAQRLLLANDPLNLLAVDGPTNNQKGDADAAAWLPPAKASRCDYVARQVSVKAIYGLWVTEAERDAIDRVLAGCQGQPALESGL